MNFQEYQIIRDTINNADVLMYKGTTLISRIIRKLTKSEYSHAGIVAWWNERLMVLEAVGKGVIVTPISSNISHYKGEVYLLDDRYSLSRYNKYIDEDFEIYMDDDFDEICVKGIV